MLKFKILAIVLVLGFLLMAFGSWPTHQVAAETVEQPELSSEGAQQLDGVKPKYQPTLMPMQASYNDGVKPKYQPTLMPMQASYDD